MIFQTKLCNNNVFFLLQCIDTYLNYSKISDNSTSKHKSNKVKEKTSTIKVAISSNKCSFNTELCCVIIKADKLHAKLDNPLFKEFLEKIV